MASTQVASSQANEREINELMSEIAFQKVLLSSVDESVENREEAEAEVRNEIEALQKKLRALRRGNTSSASQSSTLPSSLPVRPSPSKSRPATTMDNFSSQNGFQASDPWKHHASSSSTSSTPNLTDATGKMLSPFKTLPTRKRSHSEHLGGRGLAPFEDNKSRRTSPSPYDTGPTTPSASSGDEEFEMFDNSFFNKQQEEIEAKFKQEKEDAELALSLVNGGPVSSSAAQIPAAPSAFDRLSGIRPPPTSSSASATSMQNGRTSSSRTLPWANKSTIKPEPQASNTYGMGSSLSNSSSYNTTSFKTEPSSSRTVPGAFQDDSSAASDSDLEIIGPEAFRDNGRHLTSSVQRTGIYGTPQPRMPRPSFSPESQTAGEAALRRVEQASTNNALQMAMYGTQNVPDWTQTSSLPGSYLHPGVGVSHNSAYGYGRNLAYPSAALGGGLLSMNNGGMYSGYRGGSMQNARPGPGLGHTLNGTAGGTLGNRYDIGLHGNPFSRPPSDVFSDLFTRPTNERMGDQFDYIMNDPRKTTDEIKALLENIRPDAELPAENREGTPDGLVYPLYEHQKLALTWMKKMEEGTNKGGILADDMGLGKTISTLALMLSRPSAEVSCKTTLIVGPVALVRQWEREIRNKVTASHRLSVHMIHGQGKKLNWDELRGFDVLLTTYGVLGAECKRLEVWLDEQKENGHAHDYDTAPMNKLFPLLGAKSKFYRVILDEAQCVKNKATNAARAVKKLKAITRFCLTGTPMMNNVGELYSLIHFLRIKPYNEWTRFQEAFGMLTKGESSQRTVQNAMKKLQALLRAILLRRTKTSLIDGKPIINLPPKTEEIQHVVLSTEEQEFYNALETKTQIQFNKYLRANTVGKNYSNVLVLLLRLRQACCHPHLIMDFEEAPPDGVDLSMEVATELAKSLNPDAVVRLLAAEAFECPVCYDGVENPSLFIPCGHDTCAECLIKIAEQATLQNREDGNEAAGGAKCPTCRGKVDLKKVITYATFKKVHQPNEASQGDVASVDGDSDGSETDSDSASETESEDDADRNGDLRDFIVPDDIEDTEDEDDGEEGDDEAGHAPKRKSKAKKSKKDKRRKSKGKKKEAKQHISLSVLKKEASRTAEGRHRYMKYLRKNWEPSAKVEKCVELLEDFQNGGQKTIVFSQFVSLLDLLQVPIDQKGWACERYDGAMNAEARNQAIVRFTDKPNTKIMLISLKAGNAGLNLVAASCVIILDPFWNPYIEMQAVDRAYRIGQQKSVQVHRILINGTVEDRIIELQEKKRTLVENALNEDASKSLGRLDVNQLAFLFGVGGNA